MTWQEFQTRYNNIAQIGGKCYLALQIGDEEAPCFLDSIQWSVFGWAEVAVIGSTETPNGWSVDDIYTFGPDPSDTSGTSAKWYGITVTTGNSWSGGQLMEDAYEFRLHCQDFPDPKAANFYTRYLRIENFVGEPYTGDCSQSRQVFLRADRPFNSVLLSPTDNADASLYVPRAAANMGANVWEVAHVVSNSTLGTQNYTFRNSSPVTVDGYSFTAQEDKTVTYAVTQLLRTGIELECSKTFAPASNNTLDATVCLDIQLLQGTNVCQGATTPLNVPATLRIDWDNLTSETIAITAGTNSLSRCHVYQGINPDTQDIYETIRLFLTPGNASYRPSSAIMALSGEGFYIAVKATPIPLVAKQIEGVYSYQFTASLVPYGEVDINQANSEPQWTPPVGAVDVEVSGGMNASTLTWTQQFPEPLSSRAGTLFNYGQRVYFGWGHVEVAIEFTGANGPFDYTASSTEAHWGLGPSGAIGDDESPIETVIELTPEAGPVVVGQVISYGAIAQFTDSSITGQASGLLTIDRGDGTVLSAVPNGATSSYTHFYTTPGNYTITFSFHDPDGIYDDSSATSSISVGARTSEVTGLWLSAGSCLYRYQPTSNELVGICRLSVTPLDLAQDSLGNLWAITNEQLYSINPSTGASTAKLTLAGKSALCADDRNDGEGTFISPHTLYACGADGVLTRIDLDSNHENVIGSTTLATLPQGTEGDCVCFGGALWTSTPSNSLLRIDLSTFATTEISLATAPAFSALAAYEETLYGFTSEGAVFSIDVEAETVSELPSVVNINALEGAAWFVPLPALSPAQCADVTLSSTSLGWNATAQKYEFVVTANFTGAVTERAYTLTWQAGSLTQVSTILAPQANFSLDFNLIGANGLAENTSRTVTLNLDDVTPGGEEPCAFDAKSITLNAPPAPINPCDDEEEDPECIASSLLLQLVPFGEADETHAPFKARLFASHAGTVQLNWGDGQTELVPLNPWTQVERSHSFVSSGNFTVTATLSPSIAGICNALQSSTLDIELLDDEPEPGGSDGGEGEENESGPCHLQMQWQAPASEATLSGLVTLQVQLDDPDEEVNPCATNYTLYCNALAPDVHLFIRNESGEYDVIGLEWMLQSGTPRNGVWRATFDTRDYANGEHTLVATARGVGCCRVETMCAVTFANTLGAGIFYRDTRAEVREGLVVSDAVIGVEVRALEPNPRRRYWVQHGVRSGTDLDGPYQHEDWEKHQLVTLDGGAAWDAHGQRIERTNYASHVTLRLPHQQAVRVREKWTPEFTMGAFATGSERIAKIREVSEGKHLVFATNPAQAFVYEGQTLQKIFDGATQNASNAVDAALTNDQLFLLLPDTLIVADTDSGEVTAQYTIWNETRVPRFIETLGSGTSARTIAIYVGDETHEYPSCGYDLTFSARKPTWILSEAITLTMVVEGSLLLACGSKLFVSADGLGAPQIDHTFPSSISALTKEYVGLENGQVWRHLSTGWALVFERTAPIQAVTKWTGGTVGEAPEATARGIAGGMGNWLWGETQEGHWLDERQLEAPLAVANSPITQVTALGLFAKTATSLSNGDATSTPSRDERLLIGTGNTGLLFVYQRSALSRAQGAILVSHNIAQRVFPFGRREPDALETA